MFFDRHTLSVRQQQLSLYTPAGRLRITIGNIDDVITALGGGALKDIIMTRSDGGFVLSFMCHEREFEDQTDLTAVPDVPGEWWDAVVYGLAARLADDYGKNVPNVVARAEEELRLALSADREGSIYFGEPA